MGLNPDMVKKVNNLLKSYKTVDKPEFVKTGSVVLDSLLGGGVPRGSFIMWSSDPGIGKSTGALYVCLSYCVQGYKCLYLDFEGGVNESQLEGIGLDKYKYHETKNPNGSFFVFQVATYVDAETIIDDLHEYIDLVVIDSVAAILPGKLADKSIEDVQPGLSARFNAIMMTKYKARAMKLGVSWIIINQKRTQIRFIGQSTSEEAGGQAVRYFTDYRILMKEAKGGKLEREEQTVLGPKKVPYGSINEIWCIKSRYSRPFIPLQVAMIFGKGISNWYAYRDFLTLKGVVKKSGSWYEIALNDMPKVKVQGDSKVIEWISENLSVVKAYIKEQGGYRLLLNEVQEIDATVTNADDGYSEFDEQGNYINTVEGDINELAELEAENEEVV